MCLLLPLLLLLPQVRSWSSSELLLRTHCSLPEQTHLSAARQCQVPRQPGGAVSCQQQQQQWQAPPHAQQQQQRLLGRQEGGRAEWGWNLPESGTQDEHTGGDERLALVLGGFPLPRRTEASIHKAWHLGMIGHLGTEMAD